MTPQERELRAKHKKLIDENRTILDANPEGMSAEKQTEWDKRYNDIEEMRKQIDRFCKTQELEDEQRKSQGTQAAGQDDPKSPNQTVETEKRQMLAFRKYVQLGKDALSGEEQRDLQTNIATQGGSLVPPMQWVNQLIIALNSQTFMRALATKIPVTSSTSLGVPSIEANPSDADWTSEVGTTTADTAMRTGAREFQPHMLTKLIKVSKKLLRNTNAEEVVRDRLNYTFGITQENAFLNGSGANRPLGVFVASANGIDTGRDVSLDNTATAITADGLINCKYNLKGQYHPRAQWIFHRDAVRNIHKLKDANNQYLLQPNLQQGPAERLLGFPLNMSEYAPNTFTTGLYVGILGDFSYYWIADNLQMEIQALFERYAESHQVGFLAHLETDGMPVLAEAFARVKLA